MLSAPVINTTSKNETEKKISALSLSSIKVKRELAEIQKSYIKDEKDLPCEPFTETDMQLQWNKFAKKLSEKGQKIMATYMQISDPTLSETIIKFELPNEGSKIDFDNEKHDLLGYLRGKLHNHTITIEVSVNEITETKYAFTAQEKYNRLKEKNPNLELLRKTFDLDF